MGQEFWSKFISSSAVTLLLTCSTSIIRKYPADWRNTSNANSGPVCLGPYAESRIRIITGPDIGKAISVLFSCKADKKSSVELKSVIWIAFRGNPQPWIKHLRVSRVKKSPKMPSTSPELDDMIYGGTRRTDALSPFSGQKWRGAGFTARTDLQSKVVMIIMTIEMIRGNAILNTSPLLWWQPTKKECWASFTYKVLN